MSVIINNSISSKINNSPSVQVYQLGYLRKGSKRYQKIPETELEKVIQGIQIGQKKRRKVQEIEMATKLCE